MEPAALLSAGSVLAVIGFARVAREPRRLSTGLVLLAAVTLIVAGLAMVVTGVSSLTAPPTAPSAVAAVLLLVTGVMLVANGIEVVRREGISPTTLTPVVVGSGLMLLAVGVAVVIARPAVPTWVARVTVLCCMAGVYLVAHLIAFAGYAVLYNNLPDREQADAVVILGCGLHRGAVTPLLAARLERGIAAYRTAVASGALPVVVTCGGQGPDEVTSEAEAMARYLTDRDVPPDCIVREKHSRSTAENIRNCVRELAVRGTPTERTRVTIVTSNFHVLRAAALTRRLGIDGQVVGARSAGYFVPAAFLREFFAVLTTHYRRTHLIFAVIAVAVALDARALFPQ
ncbi:YdcF family protein [Nocardia vaccinii]|uniref:YdcF family protein n=1 Tax=Nocardia vaccinii TaxID=1822 RepID=UPI00083547C8|nr:YdcF family protein [Nocardia vaccinii]